MNKRKQEGKRMQDVNFNTVEDLFQFLPHDQLKITLYLRELIFQVMPYCEERLAYNVAYYRRIKNVCFIWPGAVKWGGVSHPGVRFGFTKGYLLKDEMNYLNKGDRKQVFWKDFSSMRDINELLLRSYIDEAFEIDAQLGRKKSNNRF
jgi:hypothetical protein